MLIDLISIDPSSDTTVSRMNDSGLGSSPIRSEVGSASTPETGRLDPPTSAPLQRSSPAAVADTDNEVAVAGWREALRRIEECRREGRKWLDLGNLGLANIPDELFALEDLETVRLHQRQSTR